jgi:tetratricopeptide (TPR) repeat protein
MVPRAVLMCLLLSGILSGSAAEETVRIRFTVFPSAGASAESVTAVAGRSAARIVSAARTPASRPLLIIVDPNSYGRQELRIRLARFAKVLSGPGAWRVRLGIPVLDGILGPETGSGPDVAAALDRLVVSYVPEIPAEPLSAGRTLDFIGELVDRAEKEASGPVDCLLLFRDRLFEGEDGAYLNEGIVRHLAAPAFRGSTLYGCIDGDGILRRACVAGGGLAWGTDAPAAEVLSSIAAARSRALSLEIEFPRPGSSRAVPLDIREAGHPSERRVRAPAAYWRHPDGSEAPNHDRMQQGLTWLRRALDARNDANLTLASRFAESAIKADSWNPRAYAVAATIALEHGDAASAVSFSAQGIAATGPDPGNVELLSSGYRNMGQAAAELGKIVALADSLQAPASPSLSLELARLHAAAGELRQSRELFEKLLADGTKDAGALADYGDVLLRAGAREEGREQLKRALELDGSNSRAMILLARSLAEAGETASARTWAEKAVEKDSGNPGAHAGLALVLGSSGEWDAAVESLERALTLAPGRKEYRHQYAAALSHAHRSRDAALFLRRSLEADPADGQGYRLLGEILSATGALGEAAKAWENGASRAGQDSHELFRMAAELRERRGEYGQALLDYRAMLRSAPADVSALLQSDLRPHISAISLLVGGKRFPAVHPVIKELGLPPEPVRRPGATETGTGDDTGTVEIPGGLRLLARTIGLGAVALDDRNALERIFSAVLDAGSSTKTNLRDEPLRREAVMVLRSHEDLMRYLERERLLPAGFDRGKPAELVFPIYGSDETSARARRLLRFFGVSLSARKHKDGAVALTLVLKEGGTAGTRQQLLRNLGVNLTDSGLREIRFTPVVDNVPILLRPEVWTSRILPRGGRQQGLLERFLLNPPAMRLYLALAGCSKTAREGLVESIGPGGMLDLVDPISVYGRFLDFKDGKPAFPGNPKSWETLLGTDGRGVAAALLRRDDWRALRMYVSLSMAPPSVREYLTATPERLTRLHDVFLAGSRPAKSAAPGFGQPDLGRIFSLMRADESGLMLPIDRRYAPVLFSRSSPAPEQNPAEHFEPLRVSEEDIGQFLEWAGTIKSQISLSPLEGLELVIWLQSTHPEMLDAETVAAIMKSPVAAASMVDLVIDLHPPAPLLNRYLASGRDLAGAGTRDAARTRTFQSLTYLLSLLHRQGAFGRPEGLSLLGTAINLPGSADEAAFATAAAQFVAENLMPVLRRQNPAGDADDVLFAALAGPPQKRELAYEGRVLELDAAGYHVRRMRSAIMHQNFTPLESVLEAFRIIRGKPSVEALKRAVSLIRKPVQGEPGTHTGNVAAADLQKIESRLSSPARAADPTDQQVAADLARALNVELGVALLAACYAFHGAPEADVLAFDPVFVRKHDFLAGEPGRGGPWGLARLEQRAGSGSYMTGSLSGLGFELSRLETAQWAQNMGDGEERSLLPTILSGMRSIRPSLRTDRAQEYVALSVRLGRELLANAVLDPGIRAWCEQYLFARLLPRRRDEVREALASGLALHAASLLSSSELFQLGREFLAQSTPGGRAPQPANGGPRAAPAVSSPVLTRLADISREATDPAFSSELDAYGVFLRRRLGISKTTASFADSYEQLDRVGREYAVFERICDLKIRLADLHYGIGLPAFVTEVEGELALQDVLPRGAVASPGNWKTALEQIDRLRPEHARRWIEELLTRGVLATPEPHPADLARGVTSAP